jgi:serine protease SohB
MLDVTYQLLLFSAKAFILVVLILLLIAGLLALISHGKEKPNGKISIKNLNKKFQETTDYFLEEILPKKQYKKHLKEQKTADKNHQKEIETHPEKNIFVIHFHGDIKASAVCGLREEVTAILGVATPQDEVVVTVESAGGMVHAYGLAAAQLQRFRQHNIPLTIAVDKIAASGGYLMASVANKILAAPFAIIGSIGVIVQLPNFHRLLKEKNVDFEQLTAGSYKRTLTMFGHNTEEGRVKLQEEINGIHHLFKDLIIEHRPHLDIEKVATGEHWLGTQALNLKLVDEIKTSDDYLLSQHETANIFEISYHPKKSFLEKLMHSSDTFKNNLMENYISKDFMR